MDCTLASRPSGGEAGALRGIALKPGRALPGWGPARCSLDQPTRIDIPSRWSHAQGMGLASSSSVYHRRAGQRRYYCVTMSHGALVEWQEILSPHLLWFSPLLIGTLEI